MNNYPTYPISIYKSIAIIVNLNECHGEIYLVITINIQQNTCVTYLQIKRLFSDCAEIRFLTNVTRDRLPQFNQKVAIASFPGSGNTWMRHLFHVTTGIWTGNVGYDQSLFHGGFKGEIL